MTGITSKTIIMASTDATDAALHLNKYMMSLQEYKRQHVYDPCIPYAWVFLDKLGLLIKKYRLTCPARIVTNKNTTSK
jgi:hypothetical protein